MASRPRSYSQLYRNSDCFDEIEVEGKTYKIPATMGSNYWAILRVMYANLNKPVYFDQLVHEVDALMEDYDPEGWEHFQNKGKVAVWKRTQQKIEVKVAASWQDRIRSNAKTLTRWKDYGLRLYERGHALTLTYDEKQQPYFILQDNPFADPVRVRRKQPPRKQNRRKIKTVEPSPCVPENSAATNSVGKDRGTT